MTLVILVGVLSAVATGGGGGSGSSSGAAPSTLSFDFSVQRGQSSSYLMLGVPIDSSLSIIGCPTRLTCIVDWPFPRSENQPVIHFFSTTATSVGSFSITIRNDDTDCAPLFGCVYEILSEESYQLRVTANDDPFTEFASRTYATGAEPSRITLADVNGDGISDLLTANRESMFLSDGSISILLGTEEGRFEPQTKLVVDSIVSDVLVADLNQDGAQDIVGTLIGPDHYVAVFLGRVDGSYDEPVRYPVGESTDQRPERVYLRDADFDGFSDLIVAVHQFFQEPGGGVVVLHGAADGTFGSPERWLLGRQVVDLAIGDVDGDGYIDLAFANFVSSIVPLADSRNLSVLAGDEFGGFALDREYAFGSSSARAVFLADLDGDANLDAVVTSDTIYFALGVGDGTFEIANESRAGWRPGAIAVGDMNGDAHPEVLIANEGSNSVSIFDGNVPPVFGSVLSYPSSSSPSDIAVADFDGDGTLDFVVANFASDNVSVFLNMGTSSQ